MYKKIYALANEDHLQARLALEMLFVGFRIRTVDIETEARHDLQMVPQLVIEVFHIAQMGEELPHDTDNSAHAFVSFFFIVERLGVLYHALNISSIFRND